MNRRKLEAEAIRDSVLAVAGKLDLTMGGPSFQDFVDRAAGAFAALRVRPASTPTIPTSHRRSIYRFIVRSQPQPFMAALDCADPSMLVDKRNETITPLQALALLNNQLTCWRWPGTSRSACEQRAQPTGQLTAAFRLALGRPPPAPTNWLPWPRTPGSTAWPTPAG